MSDSEAMSDEDFEKYDPDDDWSLRRMAALGMDDEDLDDDTQDTVEGVKDDTVEEDEMDLSQEYPSMKDLPEKDESVKEKPDEQDLSEEYPTMEEKKIISPEEWTLDKEYPSMKDFKKENQVGGDNDEV